MKKISIFLAAVILLSIITIMPAGAVSFTPNVEVASEAVYLINTDSNTVIYEKNADLKEYPASLTKIMTAILVLENIDDLEATQIEAAPRIFDEFVGVGASTADFKPYEVASAKDLMYGMLLQSACEAASILAYHVGGESIPNFVDMMNAKAVEIGAKNTHFTNAHGLFDAGQYTTAHDMALIANYASKLPGFNEISGTMSYTIKPSNKHTEPRTVQHTNNLLDKGSKYYYENAKTGKTGTLDESGRCLVSTASKNGYNYLLVTLNSPIKDSEGNKIFSNFTDAKNLYEWAFKYFSYTTLLSPNEEIDEIPVKFSSGNDYILIKPSEEYTALWPSTIDFSSIQREIKITDEEIIAPIKKGAKLGTMTLSLSGETLKTVDLVAADGVERSSLKYNLAAAKKFFSSGWFTTGLIIAIILAIIYIILYSALTRKRRRKMKRVKKNRQF